MKQFGGPVLFLDRSDINTDEIIPAKYLTEISKQALKPYLLEDLKLEGFNPKTDVAGNKVIITRENFGCGSSREHAALAPLYLGVKAVLVKSFARIHRANLINAGILPLEFCNEADYDKINLNDEITLPDVKDIIANGGDVKVVNKTTGEEIMAKCELTDRTKAIIIAGGLLNYTKENG